MFNLVLLAVPCFGLIEDENFRITKCNNDDGQPELTFTVNSQYFEDNLSWQADKVDLKKMLATVQPKGLHYELYSVFHDSCIMSSQS